MTATNPALWDPAAEDPLPPIYVARSYSTIRRSYHAGLGAALDAARVWAVGDWPGEVYRLELREGVTNRWLVHPDGRTEEKP